MKIIVQRLTPYFFAGLILVCLNMIFFSPLLSGKVLQQSDMIHYAAMSHEAKTYFEKTGQPTYWTNSMFGGMPAFQIYVPRIHTSLFEYMLDCISLSFTGTLKYYLILSLASFIGIACIGVGPLLALIGSIAITFATNHIILVSEGHLTKIASLGFVPMIIAGIYLLFNKNWKAGFFLFTFGLAANIHSNHIQMTYYAGLILLFYVLAEIIVRFREKKIKSLIRPGLAMLAGIIISFLINYSLLMGLKSYAADTMRGGTILSTAMAQKTSLQTSSSKNGLGWEYAMQWSAGLSDMLSILVPGAVGGSSDEAWSTTSKIADELRKNGQTISEDFKLPLYWGKLPYTVGPDYMGILIVLTFIIGLFIIQGPFKWFALFSVVFLLLQSMGKNFGLMNHFLFDYLPYYNKFRTPNSILNVLSIVVPVFSMYSLYYFIQHTWAKDELMKLYKKSVFPLGGFLLFLLMGSSLFDMKSPIVDSDWSNNNGVYTAVLNARATYLRSDTLRSIFILLIGAILLYAVALKKVKINDFLLGFGVLVLLDLWIVAKRYVHAGSFQNQSYEETNFQPRTVDEEILRDTNLSYRVFDKSVSTFNTAIPSYFHKTIGGDHPAKLRRYQDMIDYYFSKSNTTALNMLNTKYIIDQDGKLHTNPDALGNAWFVSRVKKVNNPDEEIKAIENLDPAEDCVLLGSEFTHIKTAASYQKNGSIKLVHYDPNHLTYLSTASSEQLSVYSEVWYGPEKGWEATIDGKPAEYFRVNYILRALIIPSGDHQIEFVFNPKKIVMNQTISFYSGTLFGLILLAGLVIIFKEILNRPIPEIKLVELETKPTSLPSTSKQKKR